MGALLVAGGVAALAAAQPLYWIARMAWQDRAADRAEWRARLAAADAGRTDDVVRRLLAEQRAGEWGRRLRALSRDGGAR